ncbi:hypothetical protein IW140_003244 [Coemansia sp. RSA 1813]|nr:hypothetical protein LPJ74_002337 [Coemansia sp. RSA 1843]KAJ2213773.1 hypothetical protein EV179_003575 [Coemansia sp. RSA 487]KAJ2569266.1 hypothetical protein IW140_003244 [Coemansia sp. RSA 1813]
MEYSQNYSYQGMNNVANMAEGGPVSMGTAGGVPPHHPGNNNDTASMISGITESTVQPGMAHGATARNGSPFPPQQQQQGGGYGPYGGQQGMAPYNQQQQQQQPPMYSSSAWNPGQQQYGHAGPVTTAPGTEAGDYESLVSGAPPYGNRPPPPSQLQRPPFNGNNRPGMPPNGSRPPPSHTNGYDSDSSDGYTATTVTRKDASKFSFLDSLKDSLKHIEIMDILPIAGMLGAGIYHYFNNRSSKKPSSYKEPSWMQYMATAAPLAQIAFEQMGKQGKKGKYGKHGRPGAGGFGSSAFGGGGGRHNSGGGLTSAIPWTALISTLAGTMMHSGNSGRPHGNRPHSGGFGHSGYGTSGGFSGRPSMQQSGAYSSYGGGRPSIGGYQPSQFGGTSGGGGDPISKMMGKIMGGLFKGKKPPGSGGGYSTRDLESSDNNILKQFDDSWAVQKFVAEHYYRHVYRKNMDLRNASAKTLGGAAAIRALREEARMSVMLTPDDPSVPKDLPYDQIVMGMALSEVNDLLDRKAEAGPLHPEETLEFVGKIALATIIKIKMDEEQGASLQPRKSHSEHRIHSSSSEHRSSRDHTSSDPARKHKSSSSRHASSSNDHHRHHHGHGSSEPGHRHHRSSGHRSSRHDHERSSRSKDPSDASNKYHSRPVDPYAH